MASRGDCFSFEGSDEASGCFDEFWRCLEGRFDDGIGGGGLRTGPRGRGGKLLSLGFDVVKPARSMGTNGFPAHDFNWNGSISLVYDGYSWLGVAETSRGRTTQ